MDKFQMIEYPCVYLVDFMSAMENEGQRPVFVMASRGSVNGRSGSFWVNYGVDRTGLREKLKAVLKELG